MGPGSSRDPGYWNEEEEQLFVFRPEEHFRRFLDSARLLCMEFPYTENELAERVFDLLRVEKYRTDCYIRPLAYFSDEIIGVRLHNLTPEIAIMSLPFGSYVDDEEGLHITVSSWRRVDDNMIPARGRSRAPTSTRRSPRPMHNARVWRGAGAEPERPYFGRLGGKLLPDRRGVASTPLVTDNILEGITRRTIIQLLRDELGLEVQERPIDRTEIYLADEAFFCGTGVQIAAITRIDHRAVGTGLMGPITGSLRKLYFDVVRGRVRKYRDWCTPVYAPKEAAARK